MTHTTQSAIIDDPRVTEDEWRMMHGMQRVLEGEYPEVEFHSRVDPDDPHNPYYFEAYKNKECIASRGGDSPREAACRISKVLQKK